VKDLLTGQFGTLASKFVDRAFTVTGAKAALNVGGDGAGDKVREQSLKATSIFNLPTQGIQEKVGEAMGKAGEAIQNGGKSVTSWFSKKQ